MRPVLLRAALFAVVLAGSRGGLAASDPLALRPCAAVRGSLFNVIDVERQLPLVERGFAEYRPREGAGPAIDPTTGDVYVGTRDGVFRALTRDAKEIWRRTFSVPLTSTPVLTDEAIYVGAADGRLHALDRFSGELLWYRAVGGEVIERPVATSSLVFVGTDHDAVLALETASGEPRWNYRRDTPEGLTIRGGVQVALAGDRLFAGFSDGVLVALGAADGRVIWEARLASSLRRFPDVDSVTVRDDRVYAASFADGVFALDAASGKQLWRADMSGVTAILLHDDLLFAAGDGAARAIRASDGGIAWAIDTGDVAMLAPIVVASTVAFPSSAGLLFADRISGRPLRTFQPGSGFSVAAAAHGRTIWALTNLGTLYRLRVVAGGLT